jgi:hypothetical protein
VEIAYRQRVTTPIEGVDHGHSTTRWIEKSKTKDDDDHINAAEAAVRRVIRRNIELQGLELRRNPAGGLAIDAPDGDASGELVATLLPHECNGLPSALLLLALSRSTVLVNGHPALSVVALEDRAEIVVDGELVLYRERSPVEIVSFAGAEGEQCVRCKRALNQGDAVQACIHCGSFHHEGPRAGDVTPAELMCASYDPQCVRCAQPWDAMQWNPEEVLDE